jgi:2-oxoglutarate ferredoxin oxidoreductase subunit beta
LRRNVDLKIVLFNNRIYGLTKGQTSPTSEMGKITKSTPIGSIEHPIQPVAFALAAEATFVARAIDGEPQHMQEMLKRAAMHKGVAFVEIFQNCNIFNDGAWEYLTAKDIRDDRVIALKHGQPMKFGKNLDKGLRLNGFKLEVVQLGGGVSEKDLLVHDEKDEDASLAFLLSRENENLPVPIGVFRAVDHPTYDGLLHAQIDDYTSKRGKGDLKKLVYSGQRWTVGK